MSPSTASDTKAPATGQKAGTKTGDAKASDTKASDTKAGDSKATDTKTGDAKAGGNDSKAATAAPPPEKQSQIASAIKSEKVEEVTNVNFNISIGTTVPTGVRYHPLPSRIIEIYPEWRGYDFILVRGKYIILRPRTREIVYIIEG